MFFSHKVQTPNFNLRARLRLLRLTPMKQKRHEKEPALRTSKSQSGPASPKYTSSQVLTKAACPITSSHNLNLRGRTHTNSHRGPKLTGTASKSKPNSSHLSFIKKKAGIRPLIKSQLMLNPTLRGNPRQYMPLKLSHRRLSQSTLRKAVRTISLNRIIITLNL
jgi:hypothetical protein